MLEYNKIKDYIFSDKENTDKMVIITGYIKPSYILEIASAYSKKIEIYVGMPDAKYKKSIYYGIQNSLDKLNSEDMNRVNIYYTNCDVHSKIYLWFNDDIIVESYLGSANFSDSMLKPLKEIIASVNDEKEGLKKYYDIIKTDSTLFSDVDKKLLKDAPIKEGFNTMTESSYIDENRIVITLLSTISSKKENLVGYSSEQLGVPAASGINWGFQTGHSKWNDAYLHLNPNLLTFFEFDSNNSIECIWDDKEKMTFILGGKPKRHLETLGSKEVLGKYLRKRISDFLGTNYVIPSEEEPERNKIRSKKKSGKAFKKYVITKKILEKYGRTYIEVTKVDGLYYFDFSHK